MVSRGRARSRAIPNPVKMISTLLRYRTCFIWLLDGSWFWWMWRWGILAGMVLLTGRNPAAAGPAWPQWDPLTPEELAWAEETSPSSADVVCLLRKCSLRFSSGSQEIRSYQRLRILTRFGAELLSEKVPIQVPFSQELRRIAARVVRPDQSVHVLSPEERTERDVIRLGKRRWREISLEYPELHPGDIVEYQWEVRHGIGMLTYLYVDTPLPVREYSLHFRNHTYGSYALTQVNCPPSRLQDEENGLTLRMFDIPPFEPEEWMGAELDRRAWILLAPDNDGDVEELFAKQWVPRIEPNKKIRRCVEQLLEGADDHQERLRRLYDYCQNQIENLAWIDTPEGRRALQKAHDRELRDASEVFNFRKGTPQEIDILFAAMARAAGFEARVSFNAPVDFLTKIDIVGGWKFLDHFSVAVGQNWQWQFYSPGQADAPLGMRPWVDEGTLGMLVFAGGVSYEASPVSPPESNLHQRTARLHLADGDTLRGTVEEIFHGQRAMEINRLRRKHLREDIDRAFREKWTDRLPSARLSSWQWTDGRNRSDPVVLRYEVEIPGYLENAGDRRYLRPECFEVGQELPLASPHRRFPLLLPFAEQVVDDIEIVLPEDLAPQRGPLPEVAVEPEDPVSCQYLTQYDPASHTLRYGRIYQLGRHRRIHFTVDQYGRVRDLLQQIHRSDHHRIILLPAGASPGGETADNPPPP